MILFLLACATKETSDTSNDDATVVDSGEDTALVDFVRPDKLQGFYIDNAVYPKAVCNDGSSPSSRVRI